MTSTNNNSKFSLTGILGQLRQLPSKVRNSQRWQDLKVRWQASKVKVMIDRVPTSVTSALIVVAILGTIWGGISLFSEDGPEMASQEFVSETVGYTEEFVEERFETLFGRLDGVAESIQGLSEETLDKSEIETIASTAASKVAAEAVAPVQQMIDETVAEAHKEDKHSFTAWQQHFAYSGRKMVGGPSRIESPTQTNDSAGT